MNGLNKGNFIKSKKTMSKVGYFLIYYYYMSEDRRNDFIKNRESRYGGKIIHQTFSKLIVSSMDPSIKNLSGTLYIINKKLYFEDFEPQVSPLLIYGTKPKYNKYEFSIDLTDIESLGVIPDKYSIDLLNNPLLIDKMKPLKKSFLSLFISTVFYIKLKSGELLIFNLLDNFKESYILKNLLFS